MRISSHVLVYAERETSTLDSDPATREDTFTIKLSANTHFLCYTQLFSLQYIEALNGISFLNPYWHLSYNLQIEMPFPCKLSNYKVGFGERVDNNNI